MSDLLAGAGLAPAPEEPDTPAPDAPAAPEPPEVPAPEVPAPEAAVPEEPIVVPDGAENPDAVRNAIASERKAARDANARARSLERQLREREDAERPLEERLARAEQEAREANARAMRIEVATTSGLSLDLASRLQGTTREEMQADAKTFLGALGTSPSQPAADLGGGYQTPVPTPTDPQKDHNALIGALLAHRQ